MLIHLSKSKSLHQSHLFKIICQSHLIKVTSSKSSCNLYPSSRNKKQPESGTYAKDLSMPPKTQVQPFLSIRQKQETTRKWCIHIEEKNQIGEYLLAPPSHTHPNWLRTSPDLTVATAPRHYFPNDKLATEQIQGLVPRKMWHHLDSVNRKGHNQKQKPSPEKDTDCNNKNQQEGGAHRR